MSVHMTTLSNKISLSLDNLSEPDKAIVETYLASILELILNRLEDERSTCPNSSTSSLAHVERIPSAQQIVFILHFHSTNPDFSDSLSDQKSQRPFHHALYTGNGRLVLRIWKNGCRWINLHSNMCFLQCSRHDETSLVPQSQADMEYIQQTSIAYLARAEAQGYRIAQRIFSNNTHQSIIIQPDVLFFSHDTLQEESDLLTRKHVDNNTFHLPKYPWALFSYVGEHSIYYYQATTNHNNLQDFSTWVYDSSFISNMVRVRQEYGFMEAHPRHGRVCEEQSLDYALHVLDTIIFPLHTTFFSSSTQPDELSAPSSICSIEELVDLGLVESTLEERFQQGQRKDDNQHYLNGSDKSISVRPIRYGDLVRTYESALHLIKESIRSLYDEEGTDKQLMDPILEKLEGWICILHQDKDGMIAKGEYHSLPGVICHLDLQPQNMVLHQASSPSNIGKNPNYLSHNIPMISSILDWEECCYADPRFELLLLCRKVVANRFQADILWNSYSKKVEDMYLNKDFHVGPIAPWFRLESVHSIITMIHHLCQSPNNIGGRSPWENQSELFLKIEREFQRLASW